MSTRLPGVEKGAQRMSRIALRRWVARRALVVVVPVVAYLAIRPFVASDAAALAIAGAVPLSYSIGLNLARRRADPLAVLTTVGFALGCLTSLLADGSALPLKLHQAAVTFVVGLVLLGAVLLGRPLPLGRYLKIPHAGRQLDTTLSVIVGAFLMLHALLHLTLAVSLSTDTYFTLGRIVDLATIATGVVSLYSYVRRARRNHPPKPPTHPAEHSSGAL